MPFDAFLNELSDIFEVQITADLNITELAAWSSLTSLSVITMTEEEFGIRLTPSELIEAGTAEKLYALIQKRVA